MKKKDLEKSTEKASAYVKPELVEYGSVAKLTASSGSLNGDGGQNMMV